MSEAPRPESGPIPELGPWLGRLVVASAGVPGLPLEDIRLRLLDRLFTAARQARAGGGPSSGDLPGSPFSRNTWLEIFAEAAEAAAARCQAEVDRRIQQAARTSRIPAAQLARHLPSPGDRAVTVNRFRSAGIPLERDLDDPGLGFEFLRRQAAALEASWDRLLRVAEEELAAGDLLAGRIGAWTRPRAPLWILSAVVALLALALGLSIGGYLPAPGPLGAVRRWWWSLPWP